MNRRVTACFLASLILSTHVHPAPILGNEVGERQTAAMPAGERGGDQGGAEAF